MIKCLSSGPDTFFEALQATKTSTNQEQATLVGLALAEQLLDEIPTEEHDFNINGIIIPCKF
jgi:5-formyltetrahydrofolate cyclo-ligase